MDKVIQNRYMIQLDALRSFAVLAVIASHYWPEYFQLYNWGYAGVLLFFVISGFLITGILLRYREDDERDCTCKSDSLKRFYLRRTLRIFPLYYASVFYCIWSFSSVRETWLWHLTYTVNFQMATSGKYIGVTGPFWSLGVEEQFYLLWPLLVLFAPRKWIMPLILAMISAGPVSRAVCLHQNLSLQALLYLPTCCLDSLGFGALLAFYKHDAHRYKMSESRVWIWPLAATCAFIATLSLTKLDFLPKAALFIAAPLLLSVVCVWLVYRCSTGFSGVVGKILEYKPLTYLGQISYGLYVYHSFAPNILSSILNAMSIHDRGVLFRVMSIIVTIVIASASWYLFERPINGLKELVSGRKRYEISAAIEELPSTT
jgi:peptidoglycan/LPS O-acetylase OafA/YrhL